MKIYFSVVCATVIFSGSLFAGQTNIVYDGTQEISSGYNTNILVNLVTLGENDIFTIKSRSIGTIAYDPKHSNNTSIQYRVGEQIFLRNNNADFLIINYETGASRWGDEGQDDYTIPGNNDEYTIQGPGEIFIAVTTYQNISSNPDRIYFKRSYRYAVSEASSESTGLDKFSVAMDDDGDRVVVGYKESGTNAVVRVYEFDGSNWNQLGENLD